MFTAVVTVNKAEANLAYDSLFKVFGTRAQWDKKDVHGTNIILISGYKDQLKLGDYGKIENTVLTTPKARLRRPGVTFVTAH
jgi:hypothetical protein